MASSGSESDCFESADEGSDDEINIKSCSGGGCHILKNESDPVKLSSPTSIDTPAVSVPESLPESESAGKSQEYRKRPVRQKNSVEKNYVKHEIEKIISLNEQIFKTEKIKPDVLIHDITDNLSKNFNKGITAIQQTSNSLKDLVLHTLPAPTPETTEGRFSYDDVEEIDDQESHEVEPDSYKTNFNLDKFEKVKNLDKDYKEIEANQIQLSSFSDSAEEEKLAQKVDPSIKLSKFNNEESACKQESENTDFFAENNRMNIAVKSVPNFKIDSKKKNIPDYNNEQTLNFEIKENIHGNIKENEVHGLFSSDNKNLQTKNEESDIGKLDSLDFSSKSTDAGSYVSDVLIAKENSTHLFSSEQESKDFEDDGNMNKNVEDNSALGANEGWDDFDFDDDDLDHTAENRKNSQVTNSTEEKHKKAIDNSKEDEEWNNEFSFEDSILKVKAKEESDCKWTNWDNLCEKQEAKQNTAWNLGNWGVSALLNTATCVTQGISNVIEVGLGAPDPEILAKMEKKSIKDNHNLDEENAVKSCKHQENLNLSNEEDNSNLGLNLFPVLNLVAGVTNKIVEHSKVHEIGSKVISGSLDTLETFGKKTMEVLQEGDPGLKKKRALFLGLDKPILSQVLREAKTKAEMENKKHEEKEIAKMCHFETLFDDFQGLVHLEALEMLSRQCELKLDQMKGSLPSDEVEDLISIIDEVKELCVIEDNEMESGYLEVIDFKTSLKNAVEPLRNEISVERIIEVHEELDRWLKWGKNSVMSSQIILQKGMSALAELTAATVHQFHKCGELLSVKERRKTVEEADALLQMTGLMAGEISNLSKKFLKLYNSIANKDESEYCTSVFSKIEEEAGNATTYIKDAFKLLIPVLQLGAAT